MSYCGKMWEKQFIVDDFDEFKNVFLKQIALIQMLNKDWWNVKALWDSKDVNTFEWTSNMFCMGTSMPFLSFTLKPHSLYNNILH